MKTDKLYVPAMAEDDGADLDWSQSRRVTLPNLKLSTESISLRLPVSLLHAIKAEANRRDVPYQSLIKIALADRFLPRKAA